MSFALLNKTALERCRVVDEYIRLMVQLETRLATARMATAKARTVVGLSLASVTKVGGTDLTPSIRVSTSEEAPVKFKLIDLASAEKATEEESGRKEKDGEEQKLRRRKGGKADDVKENVQPESEEKDSEEKEDKAKEEGERNVKLTGRFRPFGILEPLPAREARQEMASVLQITADLATCQARIRMLDERTKELQKELTPEQLQTIFEHLGISPKKKEKSQE